MKELVADCPRCGSNKITFSLINEHLISKKYNWQHIYEAFCLCRHCLRTTVFVLSENRNSHGSVIGKDGNINCTGSVNYFFDNLGPLNIKDFIATHPPEYLPPNIENAFREAVTCMATSCHNAAGTMFRLCVDMATNSLIPEGEHSGLNENTKRSLGLRIPWLFKNGLLPKELHDLSSCIKNDGNDGAHAGTLSKEETEDMLDFTTALLERLFTEKGKLEKATARRNARRCGGGGRGGN